MKNTQNYYRGILSICRFYDMNYGLDVWSTEGYRSVTEKIVHNIFELETDSLPHLIKSHKKMEIVFGPEKKDWFLCQNLLTDYLEDELVSPNLFPFQSNGQYDKGLKLWSTLLVDYLSSKFLGTRNNKIGKFGLSYDQVVQIEEFIEKKLNSL